MADVQKTDTRFQHITVPPGYKTTKAGVVPSDWTEARLGDIYTERKEPGNDELPLLMVSIHSGVSDGEVDEDELPKKVKRIADKSEYKRARTGDLVFNMMRAWQGAIGTVRTEGMVSPAYIVAKPNDMVYPLFMDYYMKTPKMIHTIHRQSYGVTDFRLRLYWDSFAPIPCALPSLAEQRRIAEILAVQDRVIELKEKLLAEKQRQKKYLMQQLLTGKKRLPGFGEKWHTILIGEALTIKHGRNQHEVEVSNGQYPILGTGGEIGRTNDFLYDKPSVLIGRKGTIDSPQYLVSPFWTIDTLFYSEIHDGYHPKFLYYVFCNIDWEKHNEASGVPSLNAHTIETLRISVPNYTEQCAISRILSIADDELNALKSIVEFERMLKKSLLQLLLTGIVRVNQ